MSQINLSDEYLAKVASITNNYDSINKDFKQKWYPSAKTVVHDPIYEYGTNSNNQIKASVLADNRVNKLNTTGDSPSLADGMQHDVNTILLQENMMYIIGSIAVSSLVILAIVIAKE